MQIANDPVFHRADLAQYFVDYIKSPDASSGLFLAAPRRTGKTTFIKEDLMPLLRDQGATVIYADLWEDKAINPSQVIINAIRAAMSANEGLITRTAKGAGLTKFKVAGFEVDLAAIGAHDGISLARALESFALATRKAIVMVIDEAQHAQTSEEGRQTLFALKAARDAMKGAGSPGFRLVATGSNSSKLATLVNAKDQAFYMAPLEDLELLGMDYLAWVLQMSALRQKPTLSALRQGFEMCCHRPEPLRAVLRELGRVRSDAAVAPDALDARFLALMRQNLQAARDSFLQGGHGMAALDACVLRRMALLGKDFTPFDAAALAHYRQLLEADGSTPELPTQSSVQSALLRLQKEGLVWNAGRGVWLIEDAQHSEWIRASLPAQT
jgi:hypothetical protein